MKADDNEQYSRRCTIRITGLKENNGEATDYAEKEVQRILTAVGSSAAIQRCHRVGPKQKPPTGTKGSAPAAAKAPAPPYSRAVICQFTGQRDKLNVMALKKEIHDKFKVRINEDLTKYRASLAFQARNLKRNGKIKSTWTSDGKILVQDASLKIHLVRTHKDLEKW